METTLSTFQNMLSSVRPSEVRLKDALPEEIIQALLEAGLSKRVLHESSVRDISESPVSQLIVALRDAVPTSAWLATTLEEWEPRASIA